MKDWLTALEALNLLAPPISKPDAPLFQGGPTWIDRAYDPELVAPLVERLRSGTWQASGYAVPANRRETIRAALWDVLALDLDTDTASGAGLEFVGLRFREKKTGPRPTAGAETNCRKWLCIQLATPRSTTKERLKAEALEQFSGLSEKAFERAWQDAKRQPETNPSWNRRGPVKVSDP